MAFNLNVLPRVLFQERGSLPCVAAVYFVLDDARVLYIGRTSSLKRRWYRHHRAEQLQAFPAARIAYLAASEDEIKQLEQAAIRELQPLWNRAPTSTPQRGPANHAQVHLYIPNDVYAKLKALAVKNRRTVNAEITIAIEKHVKAKPKKEQQR